MRIHLLTLFLLLPPAHAQGPGVVFAEGPDPQTLSVLQWEETRPSQAPVILRAGVEFLPIEATNRHPHEASRHDRPALEVRNAVARIELPTGAKIFRYRIQGGVRYGFLLVTPAGRGHVLHEVPGIGTTGLENPFTDRIGVANDGLNGLLLEHAGTLTHVRLDGSDFPSTQTKGRAIPIQAARPVEPLSLTVGSGSLFVATGDDRFWRCSLADQATPVEITPAVMPAARAKDLMTISGDGRLVVLLYGPRDQWRIFVVGDQGSPAPLPPPPSKYEEPTYLPEHATEVKMALNDDGSRLLYTDSILRDEIFELDLTRVLPPNHITSAQNFQPYIGVGVLPTFFPGHTTIAVGNPDAMDWYVLPTGASTLSNVTQSAGNVSAPYGAGGLAMRAVHPLSGSRLYATEQTAPAQFQVRLVSASPASQSVFSTGLSTPPTRGFAHGLVPALVAHRTSGDQLLDPVQPSISLQAPPGVAFSREVGLARTGLRMFRATAGPLAALALYVPPSLFVVLPMDPSMRGAALTDGDGLLLDGPTLQHAGPGGVHTLSRAQHRLMLSGFDT